jgi:broad specificity phosphatase PhoE
MANTWILIRHPDKEGDAEGIYLGNGAKITPKGQLEITDVLDRLLLWDEKPQMVLTSLIPRAVELGQYVAGTLGITAIESLALFNEIDKPESLVGLRRGSQKHERIMRAVRRLFDQNKVPKGIHVMSRRELEAQTRQAFDYIESLPCEIVLVVSHAKRIASYVHWVLKNCRTLKGYYAEADRNLKIDTTGISVLKRMPDRRTKRVHWHVQMLNDTSHTIVPITAHPVFAAPLAALRELGKEDLTPSE